MALPKSVKKQIKEAHELQKSLNEDPAVAAPVEEKPNEPELKPIEAEAKVEETPNLDQPEVSEVKGEEPTTDNTDWEKRYKGLQTRYNREVPELRGQLKTAEATIKDLQSEIQEVKDSIQAVDTTAPAPVEIILSDEEIEQYGEGTIEMMKKVAQQFSGGDLAKQVVDLQQELASLKQGVSKVSETIVVNNERDFFDELDRVVLKATGKSWETINEDHDFHNFLAEEVEYSGKERQEYLAAAREKLDVKTAAKFFIDYAGPSSKKEPEPKTVTEVPEELVTPDTSGGGIPPIEEAKVWTTAEIDQFYRDKREGKYKDPKEARKIEQDILVAGREGRIVNQRAKAYA